MLVLNGFKGSNKSPVTTEGRQQRLQHGRSTLSGKINQRRSVIQLRIGYRHLKRYRTIAATANIFLSLIGIENNTLKFNKHFCAILQVSLLWTRFSNSVCGKVGRLKMLEL